VFRHGNLHIHLIDTPGFDDDKRSDTEVLQSITTWLEATYRAKMKLNGVIYMHNIRNKRMGKSALLNLCMFKHLCGEKCLPKVRLATSMWSDVEVADEMRRESELLQSRLYWGTLIHKGAKSYRYDGTYGSEDSCNTRR
jgi:hypothetical protein